MIHKKARLDRGLFYGGLFSSLPNNLAYLANEIFTEPFSGFYQRCQILPGNNSQQGEVKSKSSLDKHNNNLLVGNSIFANVLIIIGEELIVIQCL